MARLAAGKVIVQAGQEQRIPVGGSYFKVFRATGDFKIRIDNESKMPVTKDFSIEDDFYSIDVVNDGVDSIEVEYFYGDGTIKTNSVSLSGSIEVENVIGENLDVDMGGDFFVYGGRSYLRTSDYYSNAIRNTLLGYNDGLKVGELDLTGFTSHQAVVSETEVVTAAANSSGILIKNINLSGYGQGFDYIKAGGGVILQGHKMNASRDLQRSFIKIPSGINLASKVYSSNNSLTFWYKVL